MKSLSQFVISSSKGFLKKFSSVFSYHTWYCSRDHHLLSRRAVFYGCGLVPSRELLNLCGGLDVQFLLSTIDCPPKLRSTIMTRSKKKGKKCPDGMFQVPSVLGPDQIPRKYYMYKYLDMAIYIDMDNYNYQRLGWFLVCLTNFYICLLQRYSTFLFTAWDLKQDLEEWDLLGLQRKLLDSKFRNLLFSHLKCFPN